MPVIVKAIFTAIIIVFGLDLVRGVVKVYRNDSWEAAIAYSTGTLFLVGSLFYLTEFDSNFQPSGFLNIAWVAALIIDTIFLALISGTADITPREHKSVRKGGSHETND